MKMNYLLIILYAIFLLCKLLNLSKLPVLS